MKPVTITYRPLSFLPISRTVTGNFPQNWGDVTPAQLIAIACLYRGSISDVAFLSRMSGISKHIINRTADYHRFKLMELLEFVGDRKPFHEFVIREIRLSKLIRPALEYGMRGPLLHAPDPKLKGVTFGQFIFADTYFSNYQESQKEEDLNKFIAALYLRVNEKFDESFIQIRHSYIGQLDRTTREAIVINYQLIHEWLALAYPLIFQKHDEMGRDALQPGSENTQPARDPNTWIKIFQNFVGDDILHDDVWAAKPVNTIFAYMTRKYKENARKK